MRFVLDMGVSPEVGRWLGGTGHDAVHLFELEMTTAPDEAILAWATREQRTLVTCDLDFAELAAAAPARASILLLRLFSYRAIRVTARLRTVLPAVEQALAEGAIVVVEDSRHRVRRLPIG